MFFSITTVRIYTNDKLNVFLLPAFDKGLESFRPSMFQRYFHTSDRAGRCIEVRFDSRFLKIGENKSNRIESKFVASIFRWIESESSQNNILCIRVCGSRAYVYINLISSISAWYQPKRGLISESILQNATYIYILYISLFTFNFVLMWSDSPCMCCHCNGVRRSWVSGLAGLGLLVLWRKSRPTGLN